jgi:hypothetical protein
MNGNDQTVNICKIGASIQTPSCIIRVISPTEFRAIAYARCIALGRVNRATDIRREVTCT